MKECRVILSVTAFFLLLSVYSQAWSAEDRIATLQEQISALEEQKTQLETEKGNLIAEGDELSFRIDALKIQAKGGLGIIGRYKLSRSLRKAQALSEEISALEKELHEIGSKLKENKKELEREYERQITILMESLDSVTHIEERGKLLEKVKKYQLAKEKLAEPEEEKQEHLDIAQIEIQEFDGPQEIREKADLINDYAAKMKNRIDVLDARADRLALEIKTRERLGEFAEEISFFGERFSREEIVSDAREELTEGVDDPAADTPLEGDSVMLSEPIIEGAREPAEPMLAEPVEAQPPEAQATVLRERNGVSASFASVSLEQIKKEIELLAQKEQAMKEELAALMKKASDFYKKADEMEKPETRKSGSRGD